MPETGAPTQQSSGQSRWQRRRETAAEAKRKCLKIGFFSVFLKSFILARPSPLLPIVFRVKLKAAKVKKRREGRLPRRSKTKGKSRSADQGEEGKEARDDNVGAVQIKRGKMFLAAKEEEEQILRKVRAHDQVQCKVGGEKGGGEEEEKEKEEQEEGRQQRRRKS